MSLVRKRHCPECRADMHTKLINMVYTKEHSDPPVEVIGIPANVCTRCHYRLIPGKVAKYLDTLVDPLTAHKQNEYEVK